MTFIHMENERLAAEGPRMRTPPNPSTVSWRQPVDVAAAIEVSVKWRYHSSFGAKSVSRKITGTMCPSTPAISFRQARTRTSRP